MCIRDSEFKEIEGLFSGGQFNGSSGYEVAASQGLIAGINAARKLQGKEGIVIDRSQGYIGVLIDDLVTKESHEPYRMMTSRAEYRPVSYTHLRESYRLSEEHFRCGYDIVVIARTSAKDKNYHDVESALIHLGKLHHIYV